LIDGREAGHVGSLRPHRAYTKVTFLQRTQDRGCPRVSVRAGLQPGSGHESGFIVRALLPITRKSAVAGIPPIEVLRIATQRPATAVGAGDLLGRLEPGKLADIVLLDANPLDDIANTLTVWRVIARGRVFTEPQPLTTHDEEVHDPSEVH
jgi:Amidohydrolase family